MISTAVEAPRTYICRFCGGGIRWVRDQTDAHWVALDAEPHPLGPYVVFRQSGRVWPIPAGLWDHFNDEGEGRWRLHSTSCARGARRVGDSIGRLFSGDDRHSDQQARVSLGVLLPDRRRPRGTCDTCGQPILWGRHRFDEGMVPLNPNPSPKGLLAFVNEDDLADDRIEPVVLGARGDGRRHYTNHQTTCSRRPSAATIARALAGWDRQGSLRAALTMEGLSHYRTGPRLTVAEQRTVACPICAAPPNGPCVSTRTSARLDWCHVERVAIAGLDYSGE